MPYYEESRVSIVKCPQGDEFDKVKKAVKEAVELIGGFESIISPGDRVLIKPNFITGASYKTGATTNPNVIFSVAELCREVGAKEIVVGEGAAIGEDTEKVFDVLGMRALAEQHNCRLVNFHKDEYVYVMNPLARTFKRIRIPRTFIESNVIINIPVMKTHDCLAVTLGLKNLKGIIHTSDKKRFHKWGLAQNIVDLGHLVMPELTIVDGTVALEGMGPVVGDPVGLKLLLASTDTIAADRVSIEIMGYKLDEVDYIRMAGEQGLGCTDIDKIKVIGEKIEDVKRPFKRLSLDNEMLRKMNIRIVACDACSGCNNTINSYLYGLSRKGELGKLKDCTIVYGQNPVIPEDAGEKIVRLGTCTRNLKGEKSVYVPGCPPHPLHIDDFLEGHGLDKE